MLLELLNRDRDDSVKFGCPDLQDVGSSDQLLLLRRQSREVSSTGLFNAAHGGQRPLDYCHQDASSSLPSEESYEDVLYRADIAPPLDRKVRPDRIFPQVGRSNHSIELQPNLACWIIIGRQGHDLSSDLSGTRGDWNDRTNLDLSLIHI